MNARVIPGTLRGYAGDAGSAFRQAPLEVVVGIVTAVAFSVTMRGDAEEEFARFLVAAALSLPLLLGLSTLRARGVLTPAVRWSASAAVLLAASAYGAWVFDPDREAEGWRFVALLGAAVMAVSLVPAAGVRDPAVRRSSFWRFNARLLARIATVVAYGVALYAALAGAVSAVSELFDLRTPDHLYSDLAGVVFFAMVPWVVVGGIAELIAAPEGGQPAPRGVRLLGRYLYAPVLAVYLAILLAYAVKVIATGEAPKNLLSPLILLAGLFGFIGSVLLEPLGRDPEHPGVARMIRVLPAPLLALLPFGLWAVWVRHGQYGWTEFRYLRFALLLALGVLAVLGTVRLLRRREPLLLLVPMVLGGTLLLASFGPWGATAVSRRSQQARLREGLRETGLLAASGGRVSLPRPGIPSRDTLLVSADAYERVSGSLTYLYDEHGPASVQPLFAETVAGYGNGRVLLGELHLRARCRAEEGNRYVSATLPSSAPVAGIAGGTLYRLSGKPDRAPRDSAAADLRFSGQGARVTIRDASGEWSARTDLRPVVARLARAALEDCSNGPGSLSLTLSPTEARSPLVDAAGTVRGELLLTEVGVGVGRGADRRVVSDSLAIERLEALAVVGGR